jgi:hypothetical protein
MAKKRNRDDELSKKESVRESLLDIFKDVEKGFTNQQSRSNEILDFWEAYNCELGDRQFYNGNSQTYIPIIRSAINARRTRFVNQIFPISGRHVEVVSAEQDIPHALVALIEHYIAASKLRTQLLPALLVNGDVEGQYTIYVDWDKVTRHVVTREIEPVEVGGMAMEEFGEVETISEEEVEDSGPAIQIIADSDFLVLPVTADSIDQALEHGGSVTVLRRWSKAMIRSKVKAGDITEEMGDALIEEMTAQVKEGAGRTNTAKELATAAGIKLGEGGKHALVYETWTKLEVDKNRRIVRAYFGGADRVLGCKLNPFWCDKVPVLSAPVEKAPGVFKGMSKIKPGVLDLQIAANDAINEGLDSATFALLPIVMTDPEKNPRAGSMILDLAAVWECDPNSTKFANFPPLWKEAFQIVANAKQEVFQALSVSPAMLPQQTGGKSKRNQAEVAVEQQVDLLSTADAVTNVEGEILTPLVQRMMALDHQFRDADMLVRSFGEMGLKATMQEIEPIQMGKRIALRWFGVEAARNAAQVQQQIAGLNVIRGIPPEQYPGYKLNIAPIIVQLVESTFGPRLAPLVFMDIREQQAADPEVENDMLEEGFEVMVHAQDDDGAHLRAHMGVAQSPARDTHIQRHQMQMQAKQMAQMQQQQEQPGAPGGGGQPGRPGQPQPGSQPAVPRQNKQAPGAIHPDQMARAGAPGMPRKF